MWRHLTAFAALCLVGWSASASWRAPQWPAAFAPPPAAPRCTGTARFDAAVLHSATPNYAHATSAIVLKDGRLRAFWYEGLTEVGSDVKILSAVFEGASWSAPRTAIDIESTAAATGRYVKSLGNPIAYRNPRGDLVLLYASVGVGRWSGASLNIMESRDEGETWTAPRRLLTTPTLNFSTLVRSPAVAMDDGSTLVPAYQEFLRRFPEALMLDGNGHVTGRRRIGVGHQAIQPLVIVLGEKKALAFSRTRGTGTTLISETMDAGWSWTERPPAGIPNFDKPVAGTRLDSGELLLIYNATPPPGQEHDARFVVAVSDDDGRSWRTIHTLELERPGEMVHYPWLIAGRDGTYHLLFTLNLKRGSELIHVRFNRDWIAQRGGPGCR